MKAVIAKKIIMENTILENHALVYKGEKILAIVPKDSLDPMAVELLPINGEALLPGFIDVHIHGSAGHDVMEGTPEALSTIRKSLITTGTTAFLPTTMTMEMKHIFSVLDQIRIQIGLKNEGAKVLGAHMEGPFINKAAKGAHLENYICLPEIKMLETYREVLKLITIAPEMDSEGVFIKAARNLGIGISLGHSTCSYDCARKAIADGANSVTHLFNAMTGLHHRDPGLVGAALLTDVYAELIADDVHVHPDLYELVYKMKGSERLILITDAMKGQCMKPGKYDLGGQTVLVGEKDARLENGTLAGSILTQDKALRHMLRTKGMDLVKASALLSANPANLIGAKTIGKIQEGFMADFVLLDENLEVVQTVVDGEWAYSRPV